MAWILALTLGCSSRPEKRPVEVKRTITLKGFDSEGEPEIREMSDGSLRLVFNFMPPSYAEEQDKAWAHFDQELAGELGVPVVWEDREFFLIRNPCRDTVERLQRFLPIRAKKGR